jgi:hypothetical protein
MLDARALIEKHRGKGVFVDTNLLVLYLVGLVNTRRIRDFKRTQDFTVEDFHVLKSLVVWFGKPLVSTPYILSQVSDLTDLSGPESVIIRKLFKSTIELVDETYDTAKNLVLHPLFERFGLGDTSVAAACARNVVVLTADVELQVALGSSGLDAINFNHVRTLGWHR